MFTRKEIQRRYRQKHRKELREKTRRYREENPETVRGWRERYKETATQKSLEWQKKNRGRANEIRASYVNRREKRDPVYRLLRRLRTRIWYALRAGSKSETTIELVGCSMPELREHLEKQFKPGMTWENYGPVWHVDHRKPCAQFDFSIPSHRQECFHWTNLQPLFAGENIKKGDNYDFSK